MTNHLASILAIDTSSSHCSVALQTPAGVLSEHVATEQSHSEHILPMIRRLLDGVGVALADVDGFAVGVGPGGFTGVRLGVAVVQGLAYATGKTVVALSSLLALARAAWDARAEGVSAMTVAVANDARMSQVYWAVYRFEVEAADFVYREISAPSLCDVVDLPNQLSLLGEELTLAGNAFSVFDELTNWLSSTGVTVAEIDHSAPNALYLLPLAQMAFAQGQAIAPHLVAPLYVRDKIAQTIAEREAAKHA
ncbi:tRNA (adenosine(37)-N6)-threonylcarbamoyltransferase complex dimerization subunit type 1 TsaB [Formosimonas limnophila]|uniref:tRNA (Adenosine(37)-N6)-threonylcarbamoyltransferase complex dimerization subunit type 1 TsaB n=1 Tax=Formosimonas limnophila TaxID=1384487 RepID=A0A8J3CNH5_9BURK|nr:tRNA (adenosine(37)-N6)-threonylcarbamoyltransferase complex dimerization subunit type 1 TsaB [Formosimonas limnophila]GHA76144.1 tRNA (adenosine(37)-N6)-threonylcarbamoyltransferase complex dimerization subunit type 1 TsaB [Formosimonas limnophila]